MRTAAAGVVLGVAFTLSPLTVLVVAAFAFIAVHVARTLPADERWWFARLLTIAFAVRLVAIGVLCLVSDHDRQSAGILFGDEAYALMRSWRMRNVLLDIPQLKYDHVIADEGYGRSSYLWVMTYLQVLAGPSPYGLRVLNASLFVGAAVILFRVVRRAFGAFSAFGGLTVLLFLPTLFFWSISLLKESFYFVLTVAVLAAAAELMLTRSRRRQIASALILIGALYGLRDLRGGAVALAITGLGLGIAAAPVLARRGRMAAACAAGAVLVVAILVAPPLQRRAIAAVERAASASAGHVFTVGHGYKLLDDWFYIQPTAKRDFRLTEPEAGRYLVRAAASYLLTPLPWEIETRGELAYLPEQIFWYLLLVLAPIGAVVAVGRDRLIASLLVAYVLPTAAVVALSTGNVGTLIRHRTLIVPYVVWVSALGFSYVLQRFGRRREALA